MAYNLVPTFTDVYRPRLAKWSIGTYFWSILRAPPYRPASLPLPYNHSVLLAARDFAPPFLTTVLRMTLVVASNSVRRATSGIMDSSATSSDINPSAAAEIVTETNDCVEPDAPTDRQADANTDDTDVGKQQGSVPVLKAEDVLPGLRIFEGRASIGVDDVREVIRLLNAADIPACVVDVNALRYYGAGRVTWVGPPLLIPVPTLVVARH